MQFITSISPTRLEAQDNALYTWKQYGIPIIAVQCEGEDYARDFVDEIIWVKPNRHWSKRTPSLIDIFKQVTEPSILINSDIELELPNLDDWQPKKDTLKIGLRTDYCSKWIQLNKYGLDVFLLTPDMIEILDNSIYALGVPAWDYWLTYKLYLEGYTLDIHREGFLHSAHKDQWSVDDYRRCSKLLEFEFDIPIQDLSDQLQVLTERTHLTKRTIS